MSGPPNPCAGILLDLKKMLEDLTSRVIHIENVVASNAGKRLPPRKIAFSLHKNANVTIYWVAFDADERDIPVHEVTLPGMKGIVLRQVLEAAWARTIPDSLIGRQAATPDSKPGMLDVRSFIGIIDKWYVDLMGVQATPADARLNRLHELLRIPLAHVRQTFPEDLEGTPQLIPRLAVNQPFLHIGLLREHLCPVPSSIRHSGRCVLTLWNGYEEALEHWMAGRVTRSIEIYKEAFLYDHTHILPNAMLALAREPMTNALSYTPRDYCKQGVRAYEDIWGPAITATPLSRVADEDQRHFIVRLIVMAAHNVDVRKRLLSLVP